MADLKTPYSPCLVALFTTTLCRLRLRRRSSPLLDSLSSYAMPHSISSGSERRDVSQNRSKSNRDHSVDSREATTEKFPDFEASNFYNASPAQGPPDGRQNGYLNSVSDDRWQPRGGGSALGVKWGASGQPARGHGRQKSINDAIKNIRARNGSVSQNAHEIADALRAPVSPTLIVCRPQRPQKAVACACSLIQNL